MKWNVNLIIYEMKTAHLHKSVLYFFTKTSLTHFY